MAVAATPIEELLLAVLLHVAPERVEPLFADLAKTWAYRSDPHVKKTIDQMAESWRRRREP